MFDDPTSASLSRRLPVHGLLIRALRLTESKLVPSAGHELHGSRAADSAAALFSPGADRAGNTGAASLLNRASAEASADLHRIDRMGRRETETKAANALPLFPVSTARLHGRVPA